MYINKAIIYGNITNDPELKSLASGSQVCSFGVATNRVWKDKDGKRQESVDYHNMVVFGRQAEIVKQYLHKGSGIFVEGRIQTRSWDGPDGAKRYRTEIVAEKIQFGPRSGGSSQSGADLSQTAEKPQEQKESSAIEYPEEEMNSEDIPF